MQRRQQSDDNESCVWYHAIAHPPAHDQADSRDFNKQDLVKVSEALAGTQVLDWHDGPKLGSVLKGWVGKRGALHYVAKVDGEGLAAALARKSLLTGLYNGNSLKHMIAYNPSGGRLGDGAVRPIGKPLDVSLLQLKESGRGPECKVVTVLKKSELDRLKAGGTLDDAERGKKGALATMVLELEKEKTTYLPSMQQAPNASAPLSTQPQQHQVVGGPPLSQQHQQSLGFDSQSQRRVEETIPKPIIVISTQATKETQMSEQTPQTVSTPATPVSAPPQPQTPTVEAPVAATAAQPPAPVKEQQQPQPQPVSTAPAMATQPASTPAQAPAVAAATPTPAAAAPTPMAVDSGTPVKKYTDSDYVAMIERLAEEVAKLKSAQGKPVAAAQAPAQAPAPKQQTQTPALTTDDVRSIKSVLDTVAPTLTSYLQNNLTGAGQGTMSMLYDNIAEYIRTKDPQRQDALAREIAEKRASEFQFVQACSAGNVKLLQHSQQMAQELEKTRQLTMAKAAAVLEAAADIGDYPSSRVQPMDTDGVSRKRMSEEAFPDRDTSASKKQAVESGFGGVPTPGGNSALQHPGSMGKIGFWEEACKEDEKLVIKRYGSS